MDQWLRQRLTDCLGFDVPGEMVAYVLTLNEPHLLDDYFSTLLDVSQPDHRLFLNDLKQRMFKKTAPTVAKKNPLADVTKKPANNKENKYNKSAENAARTAAGKTATPSNDLPSSQKSPSPQPAAATSVPTSTTGTKKKTKYVQLYNAQSADGQPVSSILHKGRHHCDCEAVRHRLINNCLHCGRIVCEQEGSGPCLFCGQLVCRDSELSLIDSATKKGDALRRSLMQQQRPQGWEEAMALRNKLLEFDRTSEKRTTVIDDESDYFRTNSVWLDDAERAKLKRLEEEVAERKHAGRMAQRVTLDFSGRAVEVVEEPQMSAEFEEEILQQIAESTSINAGIAKNMRKAAAATGVLDDGGWFDLVAPDDVHPLLESAAPVFDTSVERASYASAAAAAATADDANQPPQFDGVYNRVQDKELQEISDQRCCLSMHQPYASLLVAGIKRHEGRSWYTSHRGRLWIAATAQKCDPAEVERLQAFYRRLYNDDALQFPAEYPSGCLLGCVLVQDCLRQDEYRREYPHGESDAPFVFVCSGAEELPFRFAVKGQHKIYKLDSSIHLTACKALQRASKQRPECDTETAKAEANEAQPTTTQ